MTRAPIDVLRWLALVVALALPATAQAQQVDRELEARTHFAGGEYEEARKIYADLYARTLHPTYLRNIARCYQNLGEPDKAISSFREYLRKAKGLDAQQRAEIEGYIKEMEDLKRSREKAAAPPPGGAATAPAPRLEAPHVSEPPAGATLTTRGSPAGPAAGDDRAFYGRWWFWVAVGTVAAGSVATAILLSQPAETPTAMTTLGTKKASP